MVSISNFTPFLCPIFYHLEASNLISQPHIHFLQKQYPVFQCFAGGVFSYQTGHIKPEQEIYQLAIKQYELAPERTIYIDDLPGNIEGGKKAGLICHQYHADRHNEFLNWLNDIN